MKRALVLAITAGTGMMAMVVSGLAQQPAAPGPNLLQIEKVKDNLYNITGASMTTAGASNTVPFSGGNTAAFVTTNGVVLVDTKLPNWGQSVLDTLRTVTDKPITHIINTHTHLDHVGGNEFFPANVEIVAQENTAANMMKMPAFQGAGKKHGLPDKTYKDRMTVLGGNDAIDLYYFGPAHTNGDTFVVFRRLRVMHTGDAFSGKATPFIDHDNGGSGISYGETIARALAGIKNVDTIIPGHSTNMTWSDFVEYREFHRAFLDAVRAAHKAGKTADQAAAELKLPDTFKDYTMDRTKENVAKIYAELSR